LKFFSIEDEKLAQVKKKNIRVCGAFSKAPFFYDCAKYFVKKKGQTILLISQKFPCGKRKGTKDNS